MLRSYTRRQIPRFRWRGQRLLSTLLPITPCEKIIMNGIKATGPISFSTYMQMCLAHPTQGYYMNPKNPIFGAKGDFVTSPEISSVFGELLGVWFMSQWSQSLPIRIVELGPGRGTLVQDILRVASQFGGDRLKSVHLVETSPTLRALQETRLSPSAEKYGCTLQWHDSIDDIPSEEEAYTMLVAHEFFDALPFHVIEKTERGWQEMLIALAEETETESYPRFRYVLAPQPTAASTLLGMSSPRFSADAPLGTRLEVSPAAFKTMHAIGELLAPSCGRGLIVDYGAAHASAQSFRAFKNHEIVDVFHAPGECDLTANVDFAFLAEAVKDLVPTHGPLAQSTFLQGMGLDMRVDVLVKGKAEEDAVRIREAARRLVDPAGMGGQYQVMGVGGDGLVWPFLEAQA
ncbi:S-adenosyl-L-methionine-dependent methyltransferase [Mycena galopus ATCC 62051]|nr:S-adenosyl-L-methionine-dependent methyltransferase [Mycena galopus ATCC 62051]